MFPPGEQPAYHTFNYGWIVGELIRRISGQPVETYVDEHVFEPLGLDHTSIGVREGDPDEVATLSGFEVFDRCRDPGEGLDVSASDSAGLFNEAAVKQADWYDPEVHPKLQSFAAHYGAVFAPTRPYTPEHKGKVERGVG